MSLFFSHTLSLALFISHFPSLSLTHSLSLSLTLSEFFHCAAEKRPSEDDRTDKKVGIPILKARESKSLMEDIFYNCVDLEMRSSLEGLEELFHFTDTVSISLMLSHCLRKLKITFIEDHLVSVSNHSQLLT